MNKSITSIVVLFAVVAMALAVEIDQTCEQGCDCETVCSCEHHDPRAPIGVMGDHTHHKDGWMLTYRYMYQHMEGNRDDTSRVGLGDILMPMPGTYMMAPTSMDMQMHMIGVMYTPITDLSFMLMVPYMQMDMDMENRTGVKSSMSSDGIGDVKLSGTYSLWSTRVQQLMLNLGLGFPTGSINEKNNGTRMPYPMQLGSGSYTIIPGITYTGLSNGWGWGAQAKASIPLDENKYDYTLGNRYDLQGWIFRDLCKASSLSIRLNGKRWENIDGSDSDLNPMMTPVADPDLRAGTRVDLLVGLDYRLIGKSIDNRFAVEYGVPVYQNLDGPQLETDYLINAGWQFSF
jgi:hypothetical protein